MITAADELRHPAGSDINWSESYYFSFFDPVSDVGGFFRIAAEANKQQCNTWLHLMKGGKPLYNRFRLNLPYTPAGLDDITVGGLRLRLIEALQTIAISFADRHLRFDLRWDAYHEVIDMHEAMGGLSESVAKGHYEQSGMMTGRITIGELDIDVNGFSFRDHSWGARNWEGVRIWKTCVGQFGHDFAFAAGEITELNGNKSYLGLIFDGKKMTPIKTATVDVDDETRPTRGLVTLVDRQDAVTRIDIEFQLVFDMPYDFHIVHECYTRQKYGDKIGYGIVEINRRLF